MEKRPDFSALVTGARRDDAESTEQLAHLAEPRIRAFIYRTTLDKDLTEDLVQETLLEMFKALKNSQEIKNFRPWIFQIAASKINMFFRARKRRPAVQFSAIEASTLERVLQDDSGEAADHAIRRELVGFIIEAMSKLKRRQRAVVALRCFEDLSYAEIGQAMDCSETDARTCFFRARQSLKKQLSRRGFSRSSLLIALALFGKLTAPGEAATVTVSSSSLTGIGISATLLGLARLRWVKTAGIAAGLIFVTVGGLYFRPGRIPDRADVRSVHYITQGVWNGPGSTSSSSGSAFAGYAGQNSQALVSKGSYETWQYFPQGPDGPMIRREKRRDLEQNNEYCSWLQDGKANYYYDSGKKTVYIVNRPLEALLLPTDSATLAGFILDMCGRDPRISYRRSKRSGLLKQMIDNRVPGVGRFTTRYEYNKLDESIFRQDWPDEISVVDQRDQMHKRGWTYVRITGQIGGSEIRGRGRIPLTYAAYGEHGPWLELLIGGTLRIVDVPGGACLLEDSGQICGKYAASSFFKGLSRPWVGISAYDIVRRDAAEQGIRFDFKQGGGTGQVRLFKENGRLRTHLVYVIDMEKDVVARIEFSTVGGAELTEGVLNFSYVDDVGHGVDNYTAPDSFDCESFVGKTIEMPWLLQLAQGRLGEIE